MAVLALLAVGGISLLQRAEQESVTPQPQTQDTIPPQVRKSFATQEECEVVTGYRCDFINCDINCPPGFQKGWSATDVKIEKEEIDTSTWQTYRNEVYDYSFKYPQSLKIDDMHEIEIEPKVSPAISVHLNPEWAGFEELYGNAFKVLISRKHSNSLREIASNIWQINKEDKNPNIPKKIVSNLETATFRGRPSYKFSVTSSVEVGNFQGISGIGAFLIDRENVVLLVDGEVFVYGFIYPSKTPIADQILSTFRFVEE